MDARWRRLGAVTLVACAGGFVAAAGLGVTACSHATKSGEPAADQSSSESVDAGPDVVDPACPSQDLQREDILRGSCVIGAECRFTTPAGAEACRPDATFAPAVPDEWLCTCGGGEWVCNVTGGGFGTIICPGADAGLPP